VVFPLVSKALVHHFVIRNSVHIDHANLVELTLEGRTLVDRVVRLLIIKCASITSFSYSSSRYKAIHILLLCCMLVALVDFVLVGWTSETS
jgi:hypothetical protein